MEDAKTRKQQETRYTREHNSRKLRQMPKNCTQKDSSRNIYCNEGVYVSTTLVGIVYRAVSYWEDDLNPTNIRISLNVQSFKATSCCRLLSCAVQGFSSSPKIEFSGSTSQKTTINYRF